MSRTTRRAFVAVLFMTAAGGEAKAQFGYGYYPGGYGGYGRWGGGGGGGGSSLQGDVAQGLGYYALGAGQYNLQTAQARAINTDTVMRWNEALYQGQLVNNRNERLRLEARQRRDSGTSALNEARIRDNPTSADIANGDALNAALDQITNPAVHSSALRMATTKIPAKLVRKIPFFVATESATINLDTLTDHKGWPLLLRDAQYESNRKAVSDAVDAALAEDIKGEITADSLKNLRGALEALRNKYHTAPPADADQRNETEAYLKTLYGMARMLERPDVEKVIAELDTVQETTLGSLLGFMHNFNLRFGAPTTPEQKATYEALYPALDALRDRMAGAGPAPAAVAKADDVPPPPAPTPPPTAFLSPIGYEHLEGPHKITDPAK